MSGNWSRQIEERYHLQLPDDVRAWVDEQIWNVVGGAEFSRAVAPEQLLDPEPGTIWAGFMLPDTLPVIGNDYGDWLCLRIAFDGTVPELIHWSHCGGDWIPYGRTLAEGLIYDAALHVRCPDRMDHIDSPRDERRMFLTADWARQWIPERRGAVDRFWATPPNATGRVDSCDVLKVLERNRVAEIAVMRDRLLDQLDSPLRSISDPTLATQLGMTWEPEFVRWLFDTRHIPDSARHQILQHVDSPSGDIFAQNWETAETIANNVLQQRNDLGWSYDIAGWAAERRGAYDLAVERYLGAIQTSWFSDDTVRFRTHWFEEGYGKFAASRLDVLKKHLTEAQRRDPYLNIFLEKDAATLHDRVHQHWLTLAQDACRRQDYRSGYQYYYRAGWDLGLKPITAYDAVFEGMRRCATAAGSPALAAIAELHHRFLPGV